MKTRGRTRSSLYRAIDRDSVLRQAADALIKLRAGLRDAERLTMASYRKMMTLMGCDPVAAERALRAQIRRGAAACATAAKRRNAEATVDLVRSLLRSGQRPSDIARQASVSARHVRRIAAEGEKRTYRASSGPTSHSRVKMRPDALNRGCPP